MQSLSQNFRLFTANHLASWFLFFISFGGLQGASQTAYAEAPATLTMTYAGRLTTQTGAPMAGTLPFTVKFWDAELSGTQKGEAFTFPDVVLSEGMFSISFSFTPLQVQDIFGDGTQTVFIEIVAEDKTYPRQKFNYTPLAMRVPVDGKSLKFNDTNGRLGIKGSDTATAGSVLASDGSGGVTWTAASSSSGTITAGKGLSGGQIVTSGTIGLADTAVTPGSYVRANIVVDQQGRITSASNSGGIVDADIAATAAIDPNKIAGLSAALTAKQDAISSGTTLQYLRGDKTWQVLNTANVPEYGTAQYFSDARARSSMTGLAPIVYSAITGEISLPQADGSKHGYLASTDWATFNAKQSALGYTPLNRAGDTMGGSLSMGGQSLTGLAAPSAANDAATKTYVDTTTDTKAAALLKKDGTVALSGPWGVGNDLTNVGNVTLAQAKTLGLGVFDNTTESTMIGSLNSSGASSPDKGKTWFNKDTNQIKYWDGSAATTLGVAGSGLGSFNGQTGNTQTFAAPATAGTAPAWSSSANAHTLNIPMASTASVTAGLLSNTDYTAFSNKVTNVAQGSGIAVATASGTATVSLASTGTAGNYAKVTTDAYGRVTAGTSLLPADLPPLSAGLITSGTLNVVNGGTGSTSLALNNVILGNGTSPVQAVAPGSNGNVLTSNGTTWQSTALPPSVISLTGTAPISVTGTTTPVVSIAQASSSANGFLSAADWTTFNTKQAAGNYITQLDGDAALTGYASGTGTVSLASVALAGTATKVTYDVKGRVTSGTSLSAADIPTLSAGQITTSLGYTPVNRAGDSLSGGLNLGGFDVTNSGNIQMAASKTLALSTNTSDPTGLTSGDKGKTWFNATSNQIKYWDGAAAVALGVSGASLSSLNGQTGHTQIFATPGTAGTAPAWSSSANAHTLNIPMASTASVTAGLLSNIDYTAFSNKVTNVTPGNGIAVATASGTATVSLAIAGTAGNYAKVTTDAYGRVTAGTSLLPADLPPLSASLITAGTLNVANGGTGSTSLALNNVVLGNGTSPVQAVAPGTNGNVLTSNGTTWVSAAPSTNWTTSGSDVYRSSGNVGVGTSAPAAQLQVGADGTDGRVMINGAGSSANPLTTARPTNDNAQLIVGRPSNTSPDAGGIEFISSPSGPGYGWKMTAPDLMSGGNTSLRIHSRAASTTWTERMTFANNGNVGVGTTNPAAKLHVGGTAGTDGIMFPDGTLQKSAAIGSGASQWTTNSSNIYFNSGSVGVGTSTPIRKLHILDSVAAVTRLERSANTAYVSTDYTPACALSSSNLVFATGLYPSSSAYTIWSSDGTGDTIRMVVNASGNVGIATNSPGAQLHVWGRGTTSGWTLGNLYIGDNANYGLGNQSDTASSGMIGFAGGGANLGFLAYYPRRNDNLSYFRLTGESSSFGDNPVGLLLDGRVGIGTGSPATLLDIEDASAGNGTAGQPGGTITLGGRWYSGASTVTAMGGIRGYKTALDGNFGGGVQLMYTGFGQSSLSPGVTLNHQGQVGIGTTAPGAKLHVGGTAGTDGIMFPDGTLQKTAAVGSGSSQWTTTGSNIYFNSGNVGIGTTAPTSTLQTLTTSGYSLPATSGTTQTGAQVRITSTPGATLDFGTESSGKQWIQATNSGNLSFNYSLLLNPNGGNVGIGTTSPSAKLEVAGTPGTDGIKFPDGSVQTSASGNVSLYYTANTATALTANAMSGAVAFGNKIWDTHNAFNGSTFTAPSAGIYQVSGCLNSVNGALNAFELDVYKNNARYLTMNGGANYTANVVCGTALAKLAASDTLDLRAYTTTSGASTFGNSSTNYATWIQIIRTSN